MKPLGTDLPAEVRRVVSDAWLSRYLIELESELRFAALSARLEAADCPGELVSLARRASADERRHAAECAVYLEAYGGATSGVEVPTSAREYAPARLGPAERLTYEMVTTCCVAETQSAGNLVSLFNACPPEPLLSSMQALSRDEVPHSQLGWAYLDWARTRMDVRFLGPLVPGMLGGGGRPKLLGPAPSPAHEDSRLPAHGVLPHAVRREVFISTLEDVMFPGFERAGVDADAARAWLASVRG